ncbi:hypothetical protein K1719_014808 [Acacia pycnantha]|nr:hypothetical protein K1719_014808 [Acacia pycnantha]
MKTTLRLKQNSEKSAEFITEEIDKWFPNLFGQPSTVLVPSDSDSVLPDKKLKIGVPSTVLVPSESDSMLPDKKLKIGVILSGGQAPCGYNVILIHFV